MLQNLQVVPVPKEAYGKFYEGDAYIVYSYSKNDYYAKPEQHIHFWIGEKSSQDEAMITLYFQMKSAHCKYLPL